MKTLQINDTTLAMARDFVMARWRDRARERGLPEPEDLSGSCKFSSMFASRIFGLKMAGNTDHQFCLRPEGGILDLNRGAADVLRLSDPYRHDPIFWKNPDHRASMRSCEERVRGWVDRFLSEIRPVRASVVAQAPNGLIAMVRHDDGRLDLPGCLIGPGEDPRVAAGIASAGAGWMIADIHEEPFYRAAGEEGEHLWFRADSAVQCWPEEPLLSPSSEGASAIDALSPEHSGAMAAWRDQVLPSERLHWLRVSRPHQLENIRAFRALADENPDLDFCSQNEWEVSTRIGDRTLTFWPHVLKTGRGTETALHGISAMRKAINNARADLKSPEPEGMTP